MMDRGRPAFIVPHSGIHRFSMSEVSEKFSKTDRILKRDVFRQVYEQGRKLQFRYFTGFVLEKPTRSARIGITATRKIGNSVERNRARRLVREAFRKNQWLVPDR